MSTARRVVSSALLIALHACSCRSGYFAMLDEEATRTDTGSFTIGPGDRLDVETPFGSIVVTDDGGDGGSFDAQLTAHGRTAHEAESALARYRVAVTREGNLVRVRLLGDPLRAEEEGHVLSLGARASFKVAVPPATRVRARSASGSVTVQGEFTAADARSDYGKVSVARVRGDVTATSASGSVGVSDVDRGTVIARSNYGAVTVERGAGTLTATSDSGHVHVGHWDGNVTARSGYGAVTLENGSGTATARSQSGRVSVARWNGTAEAHSGYGPVSLDGVLTRARATSDSGSVAIVARPGSRVDEPWLARTQYGGVRFVASTGLDAAIDAVTDYGSITNGLHLAGASTAKDRRRLQGNLGHGGAMIELRTASGSIRILGGDI